MKTGDPWVLTWRSRLSRHRGEWGFHYLFLEAEWGGKKRGLFVTIMHEGPNGRADLPNGRVHRHWNWPIRESFLFPGKDWAFYDIEKIPANCGIIQGERLVKTNQLESYIVFPEALFECASEHGLFDDNGFLTASSVKLTGAHWAIESTGGTGLLHVAVDQPRLFTLPGEGEEW